MELYVKTGAEWREWLVQNHNKIDKVWLIFYKKGTGLPSIDYETAVEEALCFGWIDSIIKKIDESRYARKFTPRKDNSKWSESNKRRVTRLMQSGRMAKAGLAKIKAAQKNGLWDKPDRPEIAFEIPADFEQYLNHNPTAKNFFDELAPSYQKHFIAWITTAKRPETRQKRILESIRLLNKKEKLGLK